MWTNSTPGTDVYAIGRATITKSYQSIALGGGAVITTNPNQTGNIAIGQAASVSGVNISDSVAIGRGASVTAGGGCVAIGSTAVASGSGGSVCIGPSAAVSGLYAVSIGFSATASGNYGTAVGKSAGATGLNSSAFGVGAAGNTDYSIAIGSGALPGSSGTDQIAIGNTARGNNQTGAIAIGNNAQADFVGEAVISVGHLSAQGDAKSSIATGRTTTTSATAVEIGFDVGAVTAPTNRLAMPNNSTWIFKMLVVARNTANNGDNSAWEVTFCMKRDANAASTALVGSVTTTIIGQAGTTTGWAVSVTADTTNGRPNVSVTGAAATTLHWVASMFIAKVA